MSDLIDHEAVLIAELESAPKGRRGLDYLVEAHLNAVADAPERCPNYTTSLDAAFALAERVLPGWRRMVYELPPSTGFGWEATVWEDESGRSYDTVRAQTAPLAVCLAVLRARSSDTEAKT